MIKCRGSIIGIAAFTPSIVVMSAPGGGAMIIPLIMMMPMFTAPPTITPATTARMFRTIGFIKNLQMSEGSIQMMCVVP